MTISLEFDRLWLQSRYRGSGRQRTKIFFDPAQGLLGIKITANSQGGIVRSIPCQKEAFQIVNIDTVQILGIADDWPRIGMISRVEALAHHLPDPAIRLIIDTLRTLVFHGIALDLELLLTHGLQQEPHAIGLQP